MADASLKTASLKVGSLRIVLDKPIVVVGREAGPGVDAVIDQNGLSRQHARFIWMDGRWLVEDLGSKNRTFLNRKALDPHTPTPLPDGALLHFAAIPVAFAVTDGGEKLPSSDRTVAVDLSSVPVEDLFHRGKPKADAAPQRAVPKTIVQPALGSSKGSPAGAPARHSGVRPLGESGQESRAFAYLELRTIDNPVKYWVTKEVTRIGADRRQADIVLVDSSVCPLHAEIRFQPNRKVKLKNLSKAKGTLLNGRPISLGSLSDGDQIEIGESSYAFRILQYPDDLAGASRRGVSAGAVILMILLALAIGAGGFYVYTRQEQQVSVVKGPAAPVVVDISGIPNLVQMGRLEDAMSELNRLSEKSTDKEQKATIGEWQRNIAQLMAAAADNRSKRFAAAYNAMRPYEDTTDKPIFEAFHSQIETMKEDYFAYLSDLKHQYTRAKNSGDWEAAEQALDSLRPYEKDAQIDIDSELDQIDLLKQAEALYRSGLESIAIDQETVAQNTSAFLDRVKKETEGNSKLKSALSSQTKRLEDLGAHADILREYYGFEQDPAKSLDKIRQINASISPDYEKRADILELISRLNAIVGEDDEFTRLQADLKKAAQDNDQEKWFETVQKMEQNRDKLLELEPNRRFRYNVPVRNWVEKLKEFKKERVVRLWKEPVQTPADARFPEQEQLLGTRRRAYEVLSIFPMEVREQAKVGDSRDLQIVLEDGELRAIATSAYRQYTQSLDELLTGMLTLCQDNDRKEVQDAALRWTTQLRELSLPEDKTTERSINSALNQLCK